VWEVVPKRPTLEGAWNEVQRPDFPVQRHLFYGFGSYPKNAADKHTWDRHNRMGSSVDVAIGHAGHGLTEEDFKRKPELYALCSQKDGTKKRVAGSKPCYSHPEYIEIAIGRAMKKAEQGATMISMTPADGLGYCECERCAAWAQGGKVYWEHSSQFARRPDGVLVCITSESLFDCINKVARAVREKHPGVLIGTYAYSAYSHPSSFAIEPNVFVQTTTAFRRTPMSLDQQLKMFKKMGVQAGIRGYWSVYQWDYDRPGIKGHLALPRLVRDLRFYRENNVRSVNAEASCNWGPRGLPYYLGARLLWNADEDPRALIADFYRKAFGPAAEPMERYYSRWLGSYVKVLGTDADAPDAARPPAKTLAELETEFTASEDDTLENLKASFADLDEAARLAGKAPACRARVDHLRMYLHYLFLRKRLDEAAKTREKDKIVAAIREETVFGARLMNTNMIHARPLIGKAFHRRFRGFEKYLEGLEEGRGKDAWNRGFRKVRDDVPTAEELDELWAKDTAALGLRKQ